MGDGSVKFCVFPCSRLSCGVCTWMAWWFLFLIKITDIFNDKALQTLLPYPCHFRCISAEWRQQMLLWFVTLGFTRLLTGLTYLSQFLAMTNKHKQHVPHSHSCNHSEGRGGLLMADITLTNKPCQSGTHQTSINIWCAYLSTITKQAQHRNLYDVSWSKVSQSLSADGTSKHLPLFLSPVCCSRTLWAYQSFHESTTQL